MLGKITNTWQLMGASWEVLKKDRTLLAFPALSALASILVLASFIVPLAVFLVVPVIVVERVGPIEALRRSSALFRKTWGERTIAGFGFGFVYVLFVPPALGLVILAARLGGSGAVLLLGVGVLCAFGLA